MTPFEFITMVVAFLAIAALVTLATLAWCELNERRNVAAYHARNARDAVRNEGARTLRMSIARTMLDNDRRDVARRDNPVSTVALAPVVGATAGEYLEQRLARLAREACADAWRTMRRGTHRGFWTVDGWLPATVRRDARLPLNTHEAMFSLAWYALGTLLG